MSLFEFNEQIVKMEKKFFKKPIKNWSVEEVGELLEHFGLKKYQNIFQKNKINGKSLLLLK